MKNVELQVTEDNFCESTSSESEISIQAPIRPYQRYPNDLVSPCWLQDECIKTGEVDFLSTMEEEFWRQLIEKYLYPIENDAEKQVRFFQYYTVNI